MPDRINGGVFNSQILTGNLRHFAITGANFTGAVAAGKPVLNSAADVVIREVSKRATVVIMNPVSTGMSLAIESRGDWTAGALQEVLHSLGSSVGVDNIDLTEVLVVERQYNILPNEATVAAILIETPTYQAIENREYYITVNSTVTLPPLSSVEQGDVLRFLKKFEVVATIVVGDPADTIETRTGTDTEISYDESLEIIFVAGIDAWQLQV